MFNLFTKTPSLAIIGGGSGSFSLLSGLRKHPVNLASIVSMMDSGGDSGVLRDAFGVLPPGDVRRCLVALADESDILRDLFSFRFDTAPLDGRNFGNMFLLALTQMTGSEQLAIEAISKILNIKGRVIPVTWDHSHLNAELESGEILVGEANIDNRKIADPILRSHDRDQAIGRVFLSPSASANPAAIECITESDYIVLAPGDLFTSTIPNFLVNLIPEAIQASKSPLIYVMNLMTKHGETDGFSAARHVSEISKYTGRVPDAVLVHEGVVPDDLIRRYDCEHARPVIVDEERLRELGVRSIWRRDIMSAESVVRHDPERSAEELLRLAGALTEGVA